MVCRSFFYDAPLFFLRKKFYGFMPHPIATMNFSQGA